jgi:hypothetical protein
MGMIHMMSEGSPEDPVASALVDGTTYERVRARRISTFAQPIPRKLHRLGWLLFALAAALISTAALPRATTTTLAADPFGTTTKLSVLAAIAGSVAAAMGVALVANGFVHGRLEPMDEATAESLLALEEMASVIGFTIGGVLAALAVAIILAAHAGPQPVEALLVVTRTSPYEAVGSPVQLTPSRVGIAAWVCGLTLHLSGVLLDGQ